MGKLREFWERLLSEKVILSVGGIAVFLILITLVLRSAQAPLAEKTITPSLSPTTPTPTSTPTPRPSPKTPVPKSFAGWIMFVSDREVDFFGSPTVWLINPGTMETRHAPSSLAARLGELWEEYMYSPARSHKAFVNPDGHLYIYFLQDKTYWPLYRPGEGFAYDPQWSPTGEWIVFVCTEAGHDQLWLIRPDGTERRLLFDPGQGMWAKHPTFAPDGSRIVFWSNIETGRRQLFTINIDGSGLRRLHSDFNDWEALWLRN